LILLSLLFVQGKALGQTKVLVGIAVPISIKENRLRTPEIPCFKKEIRGLWFYGLDGFIDFQKSGFCAGLAFSYWRREEDLKNTKIVENLKDSIFRGSFKLEKYFFGSALFSRFKTDYRMEKASSFYYFPVSIAYNAYLAGDYIYTERKLSFDLGLCLGKPDKIHLILGSSFGHFLRKGRVKKEGFFDFVYPEVNEGFFAFGPFVLFRVNNIFGAPIDCSFSFEEVAGVNNLQEVISSYSGIIKIYIKKTTGVFMKGLKEASNTRRSYSIELGIFF